MLSQPTVLQVVARGADGGATAVPSEPTYERDDGDASLTSLIVDPSQLAGLNLTPQITYKNDHHMSKYIPPVDTK